jgi:DnaJ-class molecular chaperone
MNIEKNTNSLLSAIQEEIDELEEKISELKNKKTKILTLPYICPTCKGTGIERRADASGSMDNEECRTCKGLGKIDNIHCSQCSGIITTDMIGIRRSNWAFCPWCGASIMRYL